MKLVTQKSAAISGPFRLIPAPQDRRPPSRRRGLFEVFNDFEDAIAAHDGVIEEEFEGGRVFQDHRASTRPLNAFR